MNYHKLRNSKTALMKCCVISGSSVALGHLIWVPQLKVVRKADPAVIAAKPTGRKIVNLYILYYLAIYSDLKPSTAYSYTIAGL